MLELNNIVKNEEINHKFTLESYMSSVNMRNENAISKMTSETREFVEKSRQQDYVQQDNAMIK